MTRARELADLLNGGQTISTDGNTAQLTLESTDADANLGPLLAMHRNSASPADSDVTGKIEFNGEDSAGNATVYASINSSILDVTNGTEDGQLKFEVRKDGSNTEVLTLKSEEVVFNEGSVDIDFRVEGNGNANALVVHGADDFVGIGLGTPKKRLHIQDSSSDGMIILDRADTSADHQICFAHNYGNSNQSGGNYYAIGVDDSENKLVFAFDANSQASLSADAGMIMDSNTSIFMNNSLFVGNIAHDSGLNTTGHFFQDDGFCRMVRDGNRLLELHRKSNDGELMRFTQGGTEEGSISVSGSSVNFNGGHLSRWSRLLDGSKPSTLVRGTVMSNLDDMIVWSHEAVDAVLYDDTDLTYGKIPEGKKVGDVKTPAVDAFNEDNDQLNHTKVSDTEGDVNVAGVFTAWDNEDDYKDFYLGMTGDMVIRIAKGTTVARGDLLMSAGDGTAKPQGDDIVRSKTIAKVTSTNKSHTYDDGSYLVPCVLMAC
mgnify:CR=1 FL=1|tara:strand:+ start:5370 stop:6830 length:1461 start_codon:yes stop_codon:yes gene_type:complete